MSRDHYVAETYLKHFAAPDGRLHVYRKSDGKYFPCRPKDICHEWNGDTISGFLTNENMLGDYRKIFEPSWNPALQELQEGRVSPSEKLAIAGYWANLMVCTPAWLRVGLKTYNQNAANHLRARDVLSTEIGKPDPELQECLNALSAGEIVIKHEPDFIRAETAKNVLKYAWALYNADWLCLVNFTDIAFVTSDNPVAFDDPGDAQKPRLPRYLPVNPRLCLYCDPAQGRRRKPEPDFTLMPQGRIDRAKISARGVKHINRAVVQCAEDLVVSNQMLPSLDDLVRRYAGYRVTIEFIERREASGFLFGQRTRVVDCSSENGTGQICSRR